MSRPRRLGKQAAEAFAEVRPSTVAVKETPRSGGDLDWWDWPLLMGLQWQVYCLQSTVRFWEAVLEA